MDRLVSSRGILFLLRSQESQQKVEETEKPIISRRSLAAGASTSSASPGNIHERAWTSHSGSSGQAATLSSSPSAAEQSIRGRNSGQTGPGLVSPSCHFTQEGSSPSQRAQTDPSGRSDCPGVRPSPGSASTTRRSYLSGWNLRDGWEQRQKATRRRGFFDLRRFQEAGRVSR